jgi:hypothetical protein
MDAFEKARILVNHDCDQTIKTLGMNPNYQEISKCIENSSNLCDCLETIIKPNFFKKP